MSSAILMLVAFALCGALFVKCTVLSSNQVRSMRWRTKLRMRPGAGFASHWEIMFRFSRLAALYQVGIVAPQRTNKSGILADRVYGHPGAAVVVSTRDDLFRPDLGPPRGPGSGPGVQPGRGRRGPVDVPPGHRGGLRRPRDRHPH